MKITLEKSPTHIRSCQCRLMEIASSLDNQDPQEPPRDAE